MPHSLFAACPFCDRADDHAPRCPRSRASLVYDQLDNGEITRDEAVDKISTILTVAVAS